MTTRGRGPDPRATIPRLPAGVECERVGAVVRLKGLPPRRSAPIRALAWLMRQPARPHVELDEVGTWVLERWDGRTTLHELADALAAHLRLTRREAETALADFVGMLMRRNLVELVPAAGTGAAA